MSILWNENLPSDASAVGLATRDLPTLWRNLALGLATSFYWPGSGNASETSIGELKAGKVRAFFEAQSASSNSNSDKLLARAFFASDTSRLFVYESNGTYLAGTPFYVEHLSNPVAGAWIVQTGNEEVAAAGAPVTHNTSFTSTYASEPYVIQTLSHRTMIGGISVITTGGFTSVFSYFGPGAQSLFTIRWSAVGTMGGQV